MPFREAPGQLALFLGTWPPPVSLGWYDEDFLDGSGDIQARMSADLLAQASYSACFVDEAVRVAERLGATTTTGVYMLCDHTLDIAPASLDARFHFLGNFAFDHEAVRADAPEDWRESLERRAGAVAEVWVDDYGAAPLDRVGMVGGWTAEQLASSPLPKRLYTSTPSRITAAHARLSALGCRARIEIRSPLPADRHPSIEAIVQGVRETMRGDGARVHRSVRVAPSALHAVTDPSVVLDRERWSDDPDVGNVVHLREHRLVVERRRSTVVLAALPRA